MAPGRPTRAKVSRLGRSLILWLLLPPLAAGCQAPPARLAGEDPHSANRSPLRALACQVAADTTVEAVSHPVRSTAAFLCECGDTVRTAGQGLLAKRLLCHLHRDPPDFVNHDSLPDPAGLENALARQTGRALQPALVELHPDGAASLGALHGLIAGAETRLDLLVFLWEPDELGWDLASRVAARARDGLPTRVLVDGGGNLLYGPHCQGSAAEQNAVVLWLARQPGVKVLRTRNGLARFDHRKLVLADGEIAWMGGRNFTRASFFHHRDITFTLAGPLTAELAAEFETFWREQGGAGEQPECPACALACPTPPAEPLAAPNAGARIVGTGPLRRDFVEAVLCAIDHARLYVYLENAYLCDSRIILALLRARQRGVDVRVATSFDCQTPVLPRANRVTASHLVKGGVRVYVRPTLTHVKALTVDGIWAYVGSGNFDPLSLRRDYEIGLAFGPGPLVEQIERDYLLPDFRTEWEMLAPLPLAPGDRLSELVASLFL